ncbi:hypothetical protein LS684_11205 [Cytobacillus spongiae]|uniref:hypothetical protein n=1 Tax=Cytobacillus spongiae TaxID=2901381 RepID=UPI001F395FAE|nr:hypothetical protein [Cytobacillus spongiae]UII54260.1 hypothetical protein LS684_11205 [Cytobacillus spongiae]
MKIRTNNYVTTAPIEKEVTTSIENNTKQNPGDSVNVNEEIKIANTILAGEEIKQQNENL